jgi:hypothetical protein
MPAMFSAIFFLGQQGALGVLERGVADLGRAAAHQDDRLVSGLLKTAQQHDLDQVADVQRRRRRIETDIARDHAGCGRLVQFDRVGDLVDIAARLHQAQEVRLEGGFGNGVGRGLGHGRVRSIRTGGRLPRNNAAEGRAARIAAAL